MFDTTSRFWAEYRSLTYAQRERFLRARDLLVEDLRSGTGFRPRLRVEGFRGQPRNRQPVNRGSATPFEVHRTRDRSRWRNISLSGIPFSCIIW